MKLKMNKASGPDNIHINVLRSVLDFDIPLAIIFNHSVKTGQVPQDWRDANITPLHKKGSRLKSNNYRPVSLTSQAAKLMERVILEVLLKHIKENNIIHCDQHGFQDKCSCVTQIIECLSDWIHWYDSHSGTDVIYLDFSKAFDSVPHERLLLKLQNYGIKGKVLLWIKAFLSGRRQRVILRNGSSNWQPVISGVPQGSILGPILFLLYVNDLPDYVKHTAKMFADDTKLYTKINSVSDCEELQEDLNALAHWSRLWLLKFNADKCIVLRIYAAVSYLYSLNGTYLSEETEQRDLGVIISKDLKPNKHINHIISKANQRIGMFRRCFSGFTEEKIKILYSSLVRPILEYAAVTWNPWYKKDILKLEKVQKRCIGLCDTNMKLQSLEERRKFTDMVETYKYLHGEYKSHWRKLFTRPAKTLRGHSLKLQKQYSRTEISTNFYSHRVINQWNSLPEEVVQAPNQRKFKEMLRSLPTGQEG